MQKTDAAMAIDGDRYFIKHGLGAASTMIPLKQPELSLPVTAGAVCAPDRQPAEAGPPLFECHQTLVVALRELLEKSGKSSLVIGITSCESGEGVSTVAMNLAKAAAQMLDLEVVLLDARSSRPSLDLTVGISRSPGLSDYLNGTALLSDCLCGTGVERLTVLPTGAPDIGVPGAEDWNRVRALFDELRGESGSVVVDLPPSLNLAVGSPWRVNSTAYC